MSLLDPLPVHGFVLAGGKSVRMGQDKAVLPFDGKPLVQLAVDRLRSFCLDVSIAGNRDDLASFAPVVHEARLGEGPVAGMEAGLLRSVQPWALFTPVDVPLVPASLLRSWLEAVIRRRADGVRVSYLELAGERQPAFCLMHRDTASLFTKALDSGERRVGGALRHAAAAMGPECLWVVAAETVLPGEWSPAALRACFANLNTPGDFQAAQVAAEESREGSSNGRA